MPVNVPWELVPSGLPPVSDAVSARAQTLDDERHRRAFLWTTAIVDHAFAQPRLQQLSYRPAPDFLPWMAAGFVPVPPGVATPGWVETTNGFFFGLCLLPQGGQGQYPALQEPTFEEPLRLAHMTIPVLRLPVAFLRHQPAGGPPDPSGARSGTAACWAEPTPGGANPTALPGAGILTAAHVAIAPSPVSPMKPGSPYAVVGYAIDAAVLYPEPKAAHAARLAVRTAVAVGSAVDLYPQAGGSTPATVLLTFQSSTYVGVLCPHRMIIDASLAPGDSGALAKDAATGEAVGLYTGEIIAHGGASRGVCQIMQQVVTELSIDLYL